MVKKPRPLDLNWVAGFFDGEGSVGCWKHPNKVNKEYKKLAASIGQNDRRPLDKVVEITGLGKVRGPYKSTNGPNSYFQWQVTGEAVLDLYEMLKGKLIGKQEQFDKAIKDYISYVKEAPSSRPRSKCVFARRLFGIGL